MWPFSRRQRGVEVYVALHSGNPRRGSRELSLGRVPVHVEPAIEDGRLVLLNVDTASWWVHYLKRRKVGYISAWDAENEGHRLSSGPLCEPKTIGFLDTIVISPGDIRIECSL